ncbi:MAG: sialate O-acetylesterase [Ginsengibacter sp.]
MKRNTSYNRPSGFLRPGRSSSKKNKNLTCKIRSTTFFCLFTLISFCAMSQTNNESPKTDVMDSSFDLYLLIGQSNMSGRGYITGKFITEGNPNVFMLTKENQWVPAKNPLHFDKPKIVGVGPGLSFGIAMEKANPKHKIGLIPCAVGGTSIDTWKPGGYDEHTKTHPYDDMLEHLHAALKSGVLKGVIWLQGEEDSKPEKAAVYLPKLETLIKELRSVSGNPDLPFVAGQLGRYREEFQNINKVLKELPGQVPYTAIASSKGLTDRGDKTHFTSESQEKMGQRMAKEMRKLQKKLKK